MPWPCGFNYVPAHAISYTEMWMPYNFDPAKMDKELALAEDLGFNCLRVVLPFVVWEHDPAAFEKRLDEFLVVRDILTTYRDDRRVWVWDLYNEPTNGGLGDVSPPLAEKVFEWARAVNPARPLMIGTWNGNKPLNEIIFRHSDIITFHNYDNADKLRAVIAALKKNGRPVINTEWLNRPRGSSVEGCLPLFAAENVGCMHWGLVNGRTQTHLPWGARPGQPAPQQWQHDLFHGDHTLYAPAEIKTFKETIAASRK